MAALFLYLKFRTKEGEWMKKSGKNTSIAIKDTKQLKRIQSYLKFNNYRAYVLFVIGLVTGYRGGDLVELTIAELA